MLVMGLATVACGSETPCPPFGKAPVLVSVTDAATGSEICDAAVTITSSAGSQRFTACPYAGGYRAESVHRDRREGRLRHGHN